MKKLSIALLSLCSLAAHAMEKEDSSKAIIERARAEKAQKEAREEFEKCRAHRISDLKTMAKIASNLAQLIDNHLKDEPLLIDCKTERDRLLKYVTAETKELFSHEYLEWQFNLYHSSLDRLHTLYNEKDTKAEEPTPPTQESNPYDQTKETVKQPTLKLSELKKWYQQDREGQL